MKLVDCDAAAEEALAEAELAEAAALLDSEADDDRDALSAFEAETDALID